MNKSERRLKGTSYAITIVFICLILFPLLFMASGSIMDIREIYSFPPKLVPEAPKSIGIVIDYAHVPEDVLLDEILKDSTVAMLSTYTNLGSVGEIKIYGTRDGKTIYYERAHGMKIRLELDYGNFSDIIKINENSITYNDRYKKAATAIGYTYDPAGIDAAYNIKEVGNNELNGAILQLINKKEDNRKFYGHLTGTIVTKNILLLAENYKYYLGIPSVLFSNDPFIKQYSFFAFLFNTLLVIVWAILTQVGLGALTGYGLAKLFGKKASNAFMLYFLITTMIPFISVLVPQLILMKNMGAYNNYGAMLLPYLYPAAFFVFLFRGFFDRLPSSLFEAARIDGASEWYTFIRICLPLSKPIIAVITLNTIVNAWNDFFWYYMSANKTSLWTINLALFNISVNTASKQNVVMGLSFITILPIILLALIFSEQIKNSVVHAGIKG